MQFVQDLMEIVLCYQYGGIGIPYYHIRHTHTSILPYHCPNI